MRGALQTLRTRDIGDLWTSIRISIQSKKAPRNAAGSGSQNSSIYAGFRRSWGDGAARGMRPLRIVAFCHIHCSNICNVHKLVTHRNTAIRRPQSKKFLPRQDLGDCAEFAGCAKRDIEQRRENDQLTQNAPTGARSDRCRQRFFSLVAQTSNAFYYCGYSSPSAKPARCFFLRGVVRRRRNSDAAG